MDYKHAATFPILYDNTAGHTVSRNETEEQAQRGARSAVDEVARIGSASEGKPELNSRVQKAETERYQTTNHLEAWFKARLASVFDEPVGKVVTRFQVEPNRHLHLGHAKAIAANFGFAQYYGGETILRFDNTDFNKGSQDFDAVEKIMKWLGFTPSKTTYTSDNSDGLYREAKRLVMAKKAYLCKCTPAELPPQQNGKEGPRCCCDHAKKHQVTDVNMFRSIRIGRYEPKTATLRLKQDSASGNPQTGDAYRLLEEEKGALGPHRKMSPTYDFTPYMCDSFEGITHSLCTAELHLSKETYEWLKKSYEGLKETPEFKKPMQQESSKLRITRTVMSTSALNALVENKIVRGWDDPRLYTLTALRRRGVPARAILSFIHKLGVTATRESIPNTRFEQSVRDYLAEKLPGLSLMLDPIPVTICNYDDFPVPSPWLRHKLTKTIYIRRADLHTVWDRDSDQPALDKTVGLPWGLDLVSIRLERFTRDPGTGEVAAIEAVFDMESKPEECIDWLPDGSVKAEARIYAPLFKSDDPMAAEGGFLDDVNPCSETVYPNALIEPSYEARCKRPEGDEESGNTGPEPMRFQAPGLGYFAVDPDTTEEKVVLNQIVSEEEEEEDSKKPDPGDRRRDPGAEVVPARGGCQPRGPHQRRRRTGRASSQLAGPRRNVGPRRTVEAERLWRRGLFGQSEMQWPTGEGVAEE